MGNRARVRARDAVNLEFRDSPFQLGEASGVWSFKSRHRPETTGAQLLEVQSCYDDDAAHFAMYEAVGSAEVIGVRVYDSFNSALEGEERCTTFGLNRF